MKLFIVTVLLLISLYEISGASKDKLEMILDSDVDDSTKERNDIELSKCSDDVTYNDIVESPDDDDDVEDAALIAAIAEMNLNSENVMEWGRRRRFRIRIRRGARLIRKVKKVTKKITKTITKKIKKIGNLKKFTGLLKKFKGFVKKPVTNGPNNGANDTNGDTNGPNNGDTNGGNSGIFCQQYPVICQQLLNYYMQKCSG